MPPAELDPHQLRQLFDYHIRPRNLDSVPQSNESPLELVVVGGQPGAGKTRSLDHAASDHPGIVPVVGDDLRRYHPLYDQLMSTDPLRMPEVTAQAAGAWVHMALNYLQQQHRSVLLETTLRQPDAVTATFEQFRRAGYRTELRILAVPAALSRIGTVTRYVQQVAQSGAGRWAPARFHDAALTASLESVTRVITAGLVDHVLVINRDTATLVDTAITAEEASRQADEITATITEARRTTAITPGHARKWLEDFTAAAQHLAGWRETDHDLLATMQRLAQSARPVAAAAWPTKPDRADQAVRATSLAFYQLQQATGDSQTPHTRPWAHPPVQR